MSVQEGDLYAFAPGLGPYVFQFELGNGTPIEHTFELNPKN